MLVGIGGVIFFVIYMTISEFRWQPRRLPWGSITMCGAVVFVLWFLFMGSY